MKTDSFSSDLGSGLGAPPQATEPSAPLSEYQAAEALLNGLIWLDDDAPAWVRADMTAARAQMLAAINGPSDFSTTQQRGNS